METTGQSLIDFWAWAARKGLVSASVSHDLRAASREVMGVEPDWADMDLKGMDVDYLLLRFENLRRMDFKPQSLAAYKSRFKKARRLYLKYLENPSGWHYPASVTRRRPVAPVQPMTQAAPVAPVAPAAPVIPEGFVSHPFPLRPGVMVQLQLPADITRDEAERLAAYLKLIVP